MSDQTPPLPGDPTPTPYPTSPTAGVAGAAPQNGVGTAALIAGILNFLCIPGIGAILAIILGKMGMKKAKQGLATNGGVAKAGFWIGIVGLILSVVGGIIAVIFVMAAANVVMGSVDPAKNSQTGLPDGNYGMNPNSSARINDRCSFGGVPINAETNETMASDVTVAGSGAIECGTGSGTPDVILFTVTDGVAKIVKVG